MTFRDSSDASHARSDRQMTTRPFAAPWILTCSEGRERARVSPGVIPAAVSSGSCESSVQRRGCDGEETSDLLSTGGCNPLMTFRDSSDASHARGDSQMTTRPLAPRVLAGSEGHERGASAAPVILAAVSPAQRRGCDGEETSEPLSIGGCNPHMTSRDSSDGSHARGDRQVKAPQRG